MKKKIYHLFAASLFFLMGCADYLDVVPDNDIKTIKTDFERREDAYNWLKTCYAKIIEETAKTDKNPAYWGADEIVADDWIRANTMYKDSPGFYIGDGLQMAQNPYGNIWAQGKFYAGIRYCNIFIENIDNVFNMPDDEKKLWKAEVKAVKAQYYFELFRRYGPIILVPENIPANASISMMQQPRRPIDECVKAIVDLCEEVMPDLPVFTDQNVTHYCYFNKEAAATLKAITLLYAASPLFNGNDLFSKVVNKDKELLFPSYDKEKWRIAAEAADEALRICELSGKKLISNNKTHTSQLLNTIRNIEKTSIALGYGNSEALLYVRLTGNDNTVLYHPFIPSTYASYYDQLTLGGFSASMKMVEMYYTEQGLPLTEDKQWMASRYAMSKEKDERYRNVVPLDVDVLSLHLRREPRFYANIAAHGTYWYKKGPSNSSFEALLVDCLQGKMLGTASKTYDSRIPQGLTGYYIKKYDNSDVSLRSYTSLNAGEKATVIFRLPDLLLASAEAWNEYLDTPDDRVYEPLDKVRERAGIPKVRDAWKDYARNPEKVNTKIGMREIIRQEWNIEFAFEGRRFYNLRRWMTAHEELNAPIYGWNILGDSPDKFFNYYKAPIVVWKKRGFSMPRDYFFPIASEEVMISGCVQNLGWGS